MAEHQYLFLVIVIYLHNFLDSDDDNVALIGAVVGVDCVVITIMVIVNIMIWIYCFKKKLHGYVYVTVFRKTNHMVTNTEIHFLPVDECHTHALSRDTMHLRLDGQVCFYRRLFCHALKPRGCISWPV